MVVFGFGYFVDGIGEGQGMFEVFEQVDFFQLYDVVVDFDVLIWDLLQQYGQFFVVDVWGVGVVGFVMGLGECGYGGSFWLLYVGVVDGLCLFIIV